MQGPLQRELHYGEGPPGGPIRNAASPRSQPRIIQKNRHVRAPVPEK